ncbi:MAG TPA: hypothetical protein VGN32_22045, partial [Ktedonobacterales bacterium]|nr:hypothetical protein [Ktedonobacterales bacterium]
MDLTTSAPCRVRDKWQTMGAAGRASLALALVLIAMAAIVTSLWSLTWSPAVFLAQIVTLESLGWGDESAIVTGALLLLMAPAVARGKRHAWGLLLVVLGMSLLSAGIHLGPHGHSWFLLWLLLAVLLAAPLFSARSDPRALRRGYIALALSIG